MTAYLSTTTAAHAPPLSPASLSPPPLSPPEHGVSPHHRGPRTVHGVPALAQFLVCRVQRVSALLHGLLQLLLLVLLAVLQFGDARLRQWQSTAQGQGQGRVVVRGVSMERGLDNYGSM
jgi:hypothetical protein